MDQAYGGTKYTKVIYTQEYKQGYGINKEEEHEEVFKGRRRNCPIQACWDFRFTGSGNG